MLIIGAKGHAIEILEILTKKKQSKNIFFFDNVNKYSEYKLYDYFHILYTLEQVKTLFKEDKKFILGLGNPLLRKKIAENFVKIGGELTSLIASNADIGTWNCKLGLGINIMSGVFVSNNTEISEGVLLNTACVINHDVKIGKYTEISPNAVILGRVKIGKFSSIGANSTVLPDIIIGNNVIVGAGAVVTQNVPDNTKVKGIPAK